MIAFVGSVFSPYYAAARRPAPGRGGTVDPGDFCAVNVALYGASGHRWAMTERGRRHVERGAAHFRVGPSRLAVEDGALVLDIDEVSVPIPTRLRGRIRLTAEILPGTTYPLDAAPGRPARHAWTPIAPRARVDLAFDRPGLAWSGTGYLDMNQGTEPLERGFRSWHWSRAATRDGAAVLYDTIRRDGSVGGLALGFRADGSVEDLVQPPPAALPTTLWRIGRIARSDAGTPPRVASTLEDTPFYARSLVEATVAGERLLAVHESLDADRFASRWVQTLLPFRMPRRR